MIVYHGTSNHSGDQLQMTEPHCKERDYFGGLLSFCCTESFDVASQFAFRRSPIGVLHGDYSQAGVVVEYILSPANDGQTYYRTKDRFSTRDECEVLIPDPGKLTLVAVHKLDPAGEWQRFVLVMEKA